MHNRLKNPQPSGAEVIHSGAESPSKGTAKSAYDKIAGGKKRKSHIIKHVDCFMCKGCEH